MISLDLERVLRAKKHLDNAAKKLKEMQTYATRPGLTVVQRQRARARLMAATIEHSNKKRAVEELGWEEPKTTVSDVLWERIQNSGVGLPTIAGASGISLNSICRFRDGLYGLTLDSVDRLCKALGLELVEAKE